MGEAIALAQIVYTVFLVLYWGAALLFLYLAWSKPKTTRRRIVYVSIVVLVFGYVPGTSSYRDWQAKRYRDAAYAHFVKRCNEDAGEKIYKVVENVEGIFIAKPRPVADAKSLRDQFWMGDPYGYSSYEAKHPAATYLHSRSRETISGKMLTPIRGFRFVETPNPQHSSDRSAAKYLRYTLRVEESRGENGDREIRAKAIPEHVNALKSRFAITWEDISTTQDRYYWVAGGVLTIFDLQTNEILAQRTGYVIDPHLGHVVQGRLIWLHVNHISGAFCPTFENDFDKNKEFVAKVLRAG